MSRSKKGLEYYEDQKGKHKEVIAGNELLTFPSIFEAVSYDTTSLLTMDVKTRRLIGVSGDIMEEAMKSFKILA